MTFFLQEGGGGMEKMKKICETPYPVILEITFGISARVPSTQSYRKAVGCDAIAVLSIPDSPPFPAEAVHSC